MKSSDIKKLRNKVLERFGEEGNALFPKKSRVERIQISDGEIVYFVDEHLQLLQVNEEFIPSLFAIYGGKITLPKVFVDQGAVKALLNGADMMVPGITKSDKFAEGDVVTVNDEINNRPIGVGIALMSSEELNSTTHGKAIKNLHWLKDKYFEITGI
ncbi:MAG: PUA domain-containing protein [Promethearchaeota archaeon]